MFMKKIIFYTITFFLTIAVIALIAEGAFRIDDLFDKNRGLKNSMGDLNRKYCHGFKPNAQFRLIASKNNEYNVGVKINNYGFRGTDIAKTKKPGVTRIIAMGDSFTFGVGARENETIPFLMESLLTGEGKRVEVINAGFGHYSPLLHSLKTKDEYLEFKPDIALYFFDFSDLADDWRYEKNLVFDKSGRVVRCDPAFIYGKRDLWKTLRIHSKLCVYIHNKVVRLFDKIRILGLKNYIKAKIEGKRAKALIITQKSKEKALNPIEYDGYLMIRGKDRLLEILKHFPRTEKYLNSIRDSYAKEGIPLIVIAYPYGIHVGPRHWQDGRVYWGFEKGKLYDDYYAFNLLADYAKRNGVLYINTLPSFLRKSEEKLFFDFDGHFTPTANQVAAEAVVNSSVFQGVLNEAIKKEKEI